MNQGASTTIDMRKFTLIAATICSLFFIGGAVAQSPIREQELLAAHNKYRQEVGVPALQWNPALQGTAQAWANTLAQKNTLQHSQPGENLWMGTTKRFSPTQMVDSWGAEKKHYIPGGLFPQVSTTGNWKDVGHYTQIVWRNSTDVGCAIASNAQYDFLVCHYLPYGNVITQPAY